MDYVFFLRRAALAVTAIATFASGARAGYTTYGTGCPDRGGSPPTLALLGFSNPGTQMSLHFDGAAPSSFVLLFAGLAKAAIPMPGTGCTLNLGSMLPIPIGPFPLDANGDLQFATLLPSPLPPLFTMQAFESDALAPNGTFAATAGVAIEPTLGPYYPTAGTPIDGSSNSLAIGDLNGDTFLDVALGDSGTTGNAYLLFGDGNGGLLAPTIVHTQPGISAMAAGDLNGDNHPDLVTVNQNFSGTSFASVLIGDGIGGFSSPTNYAISSVATAVAIDDMNSDGKNDLVVLGINGVATIFLGNGVGGFTAQPGIQLGTAPNSLAIGDFNGDNQRDIASSSFTGNKVVVAFGNGAGGFTGLNTLPSGTGQYAVRTGDLNGDGKLDLAAANYGGNTIVVEYGDGLGNFSSPQILAAGTGPFRLAMGDLDGDGRLDLAATNQGSGDTSLYINTSTAGVGTFAPQSVLTVGGSATETRLVDMDADGAVDLVASRGNGALIVLGDGLGSLRLKTYSTGATPFSAVAGDFDADGKVDVVTANQTSNTITILRGDGHGAFGPKSPAPVHAQPNSIAAADLNGDQKLDVVTANFGAGDVTVLLGNGLGGFSPLVAFPVGPQATSVAVGDLNNDGKLDLTASNAGANSISVLLGNGAGGFAAQSTYSVGTQPYCVTLLDLDSDGKLDAVTANRAANTVTVRLGNGVGGFLAPTNSLVGTGPLYVTPAEFNGDGIPDLAVANSNGGTATVLINNGSGAFPVKHAYLFGTNASFVAVSDIDGDSRSDLLGGSIVAHNGQIFARLGTGAGTLGPLFSFDFGLDPSFVIARDLDGDEKDDLIAPNIDAHNSIGVLLHR